MTAGSFSHISIKSRKSLDLTNNICSGERKIMDCLVHGRGEEMLGPGYLPYSLKLACWLDDEVYLDWLPKEKLSLRKVTHGEDKIGH